MDEKVLGDIREAIGEASGIPCEKLFRYTKIWVSPKRAKDFKIISKKPNARGQWLAEVCWILARSSGCFFGTLVSVAECVGGSERLQFALNLWLKLLVALYVDDMRGETRPAAVQSSLGLMSLYLSLIGRPESFEK